MQYIYYYYYSIIYYYIIIECRQKTVILTVYKTV